MSNHIEYEIVLDQHEGIVCIFNEETRHLEKCPVGNAIWRAFKRRYKMVDDSESKANPYLSLEYRRWVLHMYVFGCTDTRTPGEYLGWNR